MSFFDVVTLIVFVSFFINIFWIVFLLSVYLINIIYTIVIDRVSKIQNPVLIRNITMFVVCSFFYTCFTDTTRKLDHNMIN